MMFKLNKYDVDTDYTQLVQTKVCRQDYEINGHNFKEKGQKKKI